MAGSSMLEVPALPIIITHCLCGHCLHGKSPITIGLITLCTWTNQIIVILGCVINILNMHVAVTEAKH